VTRVVRLNDPKYNKDSFENNGVAHDDMIFPDGSTPPQEIVERFINTCETHFSDPQAGAVAIHCKAGLGRTGTLIGLYCMKHY
jgi:cell division cycle 14